MTQFQTGVRMCLFGMRLEVTILTRSCGLDLREWLGGIIYL
jgi:hypothetical protein